MQIQNYSDEILLSIISNIKTESKSQIVKITLNADIPKTCLQIPSKLDFGPIVVKEESTLQFEMINKGHIPINFKWITNNSPLMFEPSQGVITDNKPQTININLSPQKPN